MEKIVNFFQEVIFLKFLKRSPFMILIIILFSGTHFASAISNDEWTQYRLNSKNNPVISNHKGIFDTSLKTNNEIRSTPVVVDDRIYVGNHDSGDVSAYNLETGELKWHKQAPNWVHSEMIDVDGKIFVDMAIVFFKRMV